jgi:hypothetical protein
MHDLELAAMVHAFNI